MKHTSHRKVRYGKYQYFLFFLVPLLLIILGVGIIKNENSTMKILKETTLESLFRYEDRRNGFQEGLWALAHEDKVFCRF